MNYLELMKTRRSIRKYTSDPIESELTDLIQEEINKINEESGFYFQMVLNNDDVLGNKLVTFGMFKNARNIIALVAPDDENDDDGTVDENIGYYGARILLYMHSLGLGTCFLTGTYSRGKTRAYVVEKQKNYGIICFGHGESFPNKPRKTKTIDKISDCRDADPQWYKDGLEGALLAPTAINAQPFEIFRDGAELVFIRPLFGVNPILDAGIIKYFFEKAANSDAYLWKRIHNQDR